MFGDVIVAWFPKQIQAVKPKIDKGDVVTTKLIATRLRFQKAVVVA